MNKIKYTCKKGLKKTKHLLRKGGRFGSRIFENIEEYFDEDVQQAMEFKPRFRRKLQF